MENRSKLMREISIRAAKKEKDVGITDILLSKAFADYAQNLARSCAGKRKTALTVVVYAKNTDKAVAYTDGRAIHINVGHVMFETFTSPINRFLCVLGVLLHEAAHVRFLNFNEENKRLAQIKAGVLPELSAGVDCAALQTAIANERYRPLLVSLYHHLSNCISDGHDERCMCAAFGSLVKEAIGTSSLAAKASARTVEQYLRMENGDSISAIFALILYYARFQDVLVEGEQGIDSDLMDQFLTTVPHVKCALSTDVTAKKYEELSNIILILWDEIQKKLDALPTPPDNVSEPQNNKQNSTQDNASESQKNAQDNVQKNASGNVQDDESEDSLQDGNSALEQEAVDKLLLSLNQVATQIQSSTETKQGCSPENMRQDDIVCADENNQAAATLAMQQLAHEIAMTQATQEVGKEHNAEVNQEVCAINARGSHKNFTVRQDELANVTEKQISDYDDDAKEVLQYSQSLQKRMKQVLEELREGGVTRHCARGKKICTRDLYAADGLLFERKHQPEELPSMAITLLLDQSGSMSGARLKAAQKAAILLEDFARGLQVPLCICGHHTQGDQVRLTVFSDFERVSKRERYHIEQIKAAGCNRDGAALYVAAERLARRPETIKLIFIVSDGKPNHYNYGGLEAVNDIRGIVRRATANGVTVFAAAIGDDKEQISDIYGQGFIDISDLATLPKTLIKIVKRKLLQ